ncbi:hypothetical protein [Streptomyces bambusae]|uniref:Uncharacterized protein n=1 Tax=Streptomyces bambusae TaxID=1550616 RepID=A0ABS6YZQ6_9ACTN|nr:hypothetical protein [Streptomyces bambusae]MBW5480947.1 hypothetical protein [Streptomyces bambusae]
MILAIDAAAGSLTWLRSTGWTALAVLVFVILLPPRISARPGALSARGLLTERAVRTDALVSVRWHDGIAQRMILRDADGRRMEIDPNVLVRNPALWHRVDTDSQISLERGTLLCGATALRQLAQRVDRETARTVFQISELD